MSTALNEPANDGISPGCRARPKRIRWGGTIFFKVEESVFEAPRYRFGEESEVFETMFHLPTASDGTVEGRDEEHPIVLEGYRAADFGALLSVLCPTTDDLISGRFALEKDEWIGVLNLSTRWIMKKIRKHAINELSKIALAPVEKVALGREHKVAKWFKDGLTELVSECPISPLTELKSQLGAEMACTLLWIHIQTLPKPGENGLFLASLTLGMLACCHWTCNGHILYQPAKCVVQELLEARALLRDLSLSFVFPQ
ncbi:hypothetical protein EST38_g7605 [Candolleomyces aberdarensis]|uniref:BTB domain-containing protein n=1 Tax=Candolleomyces aberdarensis TaxID=2316362 RepID=A0A4Q2DF83_9AGAR|nr:hypothetical protein EST38_g7605 [Candolleomyces aberdarensis]